MRPLTRLVLARLKRQESERLDLIHRLLDELPDGAHVEHLLSHLGDHVTLAARSKAKQAKVGGDAVSVAVLEDAHREVVDAIAEVIRWGYRQQDGDAPEELGTRESPVVKVDDHSNFVDACFRTKHAGLEERRGPVRIFTTNYDTLVEDALAYGRIPAWDGFEGGAVAFRAFRFGEPEPERGFRAHVVKLHGSIDWYLDEEGRIWRLRDGERGPQAKARVLIYPRSTKYVATQRDPFAAHFDLFRRTLAAAEENALAICGYSFGDDHINEEIELAMGRPESRTTLLAFAREDTALPDCLDRWRRGPWGARVYVATERGAYIGKDGPFHEPPAAKERDWWTFRGVTRVLRDGAGALA